ncbi:fatty acid desaturase [Reyranella sp. CPCC 100927]|uniref:fatty acid desaturase n=1 Tax=Reyranella sp. CPCC 100927 TaxID=2599616 RepID=UPI001C49C7FD|nr:fatty acid desaturase [Reyranella sp. CPCC 100927]
MSDPSMTAPDAARPIVREAAAFDAAALHRQLAAHQSASTARSLGQLASSFLPFLALCATMYGTLAVSYGLTLVLAVPAAGFLVRIFIIQHDCGHGAFFRSRAANTWVGRLCSIATLTPYANWRRQHAGHHANWNNLDHQASGSDIYSACLTTADYRRLRPVPRLLHRLLRHPAIALVVLPPLVFLLLYRVPFDTPAHWRRERRSVHATNLVLATLVVGLGLVAGFGAVALVQLPIMVLAAIAGVWLFSVQHRFEDAHWFTQGDWSATAAALRGTSYLRLPAILQWFTGNIGFHHVHHLNPRIPNYRLAACHAQNVDLQHVPTLSLRDALKASTYCLWDEAQQRMVRFGDCPRPAAAADATR